jgi:hypothetical protein
MEKEIILNLSLYRLGQALRAPEVEATRIYRQSAHKAVRLSTLGTGRLYPPKRSLVFISVRGWVDPRAIVRSEGLSRCRILMTPSEIEPTTFRVVTQFLNKLRHRATPLEQDYVHKVPVILIDNLQRDSHKPYSPPTSVTWLQLLRKQSNNDTSTALTAETRWSTRTRLCALSCLLTSA